MLKLPATSPAAPASKASKTPTSMAKPGAARTAGAVKPASPTKLTTRPKLAISAKHSGTHGSQLTVAVIAGLAISLVTLLIYSFSGPTKPWVFDSPKAQLPSLQAKHTLY